MAVSPSLYNVPPSGQFCQCVFGGREGLYLPTSPVTRTWAICWKVSDPLGRSLLSTTFGWCHSSSCKIWGIPGRMLMRRSFSFASTDSRSVSAKRRQSSNTWTRGGSSSFIPLSAYSSRDGSARFRPRTTISAACSATISPHSSSCQSPRSIG